MVERQVRQLVRLVDDLMEISRITRGKIELEKARVPLGDILAAAIETSQPLIEQAGHQLAITLPPGQLLVDADPTRLTQVFANLLNNAARYTEAGGRIQVSAWREGDTAVASVRDNGIGIAADRVPHVFEMFAQGHRTAGRAQGGLGIGLTMVRELVHMHGGTVSVHSAGAGLGTEVIVRLPLAQPEECLRPAQALESAGAPGRLVGRRVLIADDNRDAADSLRMLLSAAGADAESVYDGPATLAALERVQPQVPILDIGMPGMDGYEVARRIRRDHRFDRVSIVALTGWGQQADRARSRESGIDHHLTKPADLAALEELVAS
jgi:CheY-like chemotaxis protein